MPAGCPTMRCHKGAGAWPGGGNVWAATEAGRATSTQQRWRGAAPAAGWHEGVGQLVNPFEDSPKHPAQQVRSNFSAGSVHWSDLHVHLSDLHVPCLEALHVAVALLISHSSTTNASAASRLDVRL